ncbi:MAG: alternative ribosome rescue aminoacyl-tRNA hydrolase ArfB [Alphaproteobacteria bacterium]
MLRINDSLSIDEEELEESFTRSRGPGGQNVNKVETAVQLRFDAGNSPSLPGAVRHRLQKIAGARLTSDGVIVISADRFRTREANRRDARDRLADLIARAAVAPRRRVATKPSRAARKRRTDRKTYRGRVKQLRGKPGRGEN